MNKTCFNGLYRVNREGRFNVPYGKYKNPRINDEGNLRNVSEVLQRISIECIDFKKGLRTAKKGDLVYLDPPYQPISETSAFTSYTSDMFDEKAQERLAKTFFELTDRGCLVLESNSDTERIRELYNYDDAHIHEVMAPRVINCKPSGRGPITELVISNYEFNPSGVA